jgi:hypothetical protein
MFRLTCFILLSMKTTLNWVYTNVILSIEWRICINNFIFKKVYWVQHNSQWCRKLIKKWKKSEIFMMKNETNINALKLIHQIRNINMNAIIRISRVNMWLSKTRWERRMKRIKKIWMYFEYVRSDKVEHCNTSFVFNKLIHEVVALTT